MGEGFYFVEILVFALFAGFLVYRLRSVLGRRHGEERQRPNPFAVDRPGPAVPDNVIPLPERGRPAEAKEAATEPFSLAAGLAQIKDVDPGFDEKHFVQGGALICADDSGYKQAYEAVRIADLIVHHGKNPAEISTLSPTRGAIIANRERARMLGIDLSNQKQIEEFVNTAKALEKYPAGD